MALDGQKKKYIASRKAPVGEVKVIEAIPHNPSPESDGTIQMVAYGSGPQIKRLDGHGNGSQELELNSTTTTSIVSNGYVENPVYNNGSGPINVKVVDPLNVVDGYFECLFTDYNATTSNAADTADWIINRYSSEGGAFIESVSSKRSIAINNEQIIPGWGISVQINQEKYYFPEGASGDAKSKTTDFLSGTITYTDSSKRWLSAVPDGDGFNAFNWIRSGDYDPTNGTAATDDDDCTDATADDYLAYTDPCNYADVLNQDTDKSWAGILEGGIAPHKLVGYEASYMPIAYDNYAGVNVARQLSSLSWLPSVDIVFTSDKSKWTRCPVIELGREEELNFGGAAPGELRASPSVDENGDPDGTGNGMGWFPGYAIDVESGARLYMAFGENSFLVSDNGADMIWNPTNRVVDNNGTPILGGMHAFYVFSFQNKAKRITSYKLKTIQLIFQVKQKTMQPTNCIMTSKTLQQIKLQQRRRFTVVFLG